MYGQHGEHRHFGPPVATVLRGESADSIHRARAATRAFTGGLIPAPAPAVADTLVLVVSELATNALRHGGGHYTLELSASPDTLAAAVSDRSPAAPRERTPTSTTETADSAGTWSATSPATSPSHPAREPENYPRPTPPTAPQSNLMSLRWTRHGRRP